jgi:large subunit ribosomal protein L2
MPVKKYNPTTPGLRQRVGNAYTEITKDEPEKSLTVGIKQNAGRNDDGRMTMRYRGGGHKKLYRIIDFKRDKIGVPAKVHSIEYDPNRSAFIALLHYLDGEKRYIVAPHGLKVGTQIVSGDSVPIETGNSMPLAFVPFGATVHAIEMQPGKGAALARSAGTYAQVMGREGKYTIVKLPSGETRRVLSVCRATIGTVSNPDHGLQVLGKAGRKRWLGRRPRTRPVAMNPVDHPMGGGEGRASGGHPRSRKGLIAKGAKTRNNKKHSSDLIISRKKKKR